MYKNVLTEATIIGHYGAEWAKASGLNVKKEEFDTLTKLFAQKSNAISPITFGGNKYQVTHYDEEGAFSNLRIKYCDTTVAKTNQAYFIDV